MAKRQNKKKSGTGLRLTFDHKVGKHNFRFREAPTPNAWGVADIGAGLIEIHPKIRKHSVTFQRMILIHESLHLLCPRWGEDRVARITKILSQILRKAKV